MNTKKSTRKRMFLIDGYAMLYRAHYAMIRNPLITSYGLPTSALFGFLNERPDFLDIALVYALINFISTIAILKFFEYGDISKGSTEKEEADI